MSEAKTAGQQSNDETVKQLKKEKEAQGPLQMTGMEMEDNPDGTAITLMPRFKTFGEIFEYCNWIASSNIVPEAYKNRPADIFAAAQYGADIGLRFMTAIQNIAIIGGRPALPSDIKLAMVRSRKLLEDFDEATDEEIRETGKAWCMMKRAGVPRPVKHSYTIEDAKNAGLWERRGSNNYPTPWVTYKFRMLQLKSRDMVLRDLFGDVFKGLHSVEEARDIQLIEAEATPQAQIAQASQPETAGKAILATALPPLKPVDTRIATDISEEEKKVIAGDGPGQVIGGTIPLQGTATKAFADAVDSATDEMRALPNGNTALLKIWSSYKMPVAQFAKGKPSSLLSDTQLDAFSQEIEKFLEANSPKK